MQKELHLQAKGFELFIFDEGSGNFLSAEIEKYAHACAEAFSDFLYEGDLKDFFRKKKVNLISVNLEICSSEKIKEINSEYRNKFKETDVLSFPSQEDLRNKKADIFISELEIGDIFICEEVCIKQASEFQISVNDELVHLLTHGFLHLCGYDHEISDEEELLMQDHEKKLIEKVSKLLS